MKIKLSYLVIAAGVAAIAAVLLHESGFVPPNARAAPYLYSNDGAAPPDVSKVKMIMTKSGINVFTLAFVRAGDEGCEPKWDGWRPLSDDEHPLDKEQNRELYLIDAIRGNGGDVEVSIGGASGNKLELTCSSNTELAGAYQKVISKYGLKYIDIDVENDERFKDPNIQARIVGALKIIKDNNPKVTTMLTLSALESADTSENNDDYAMNLIKRSKSIGANVDVFNIMPFDFDRGTDMHNNTLNAAEDLRSVLKSVFGWSDAIAYAHMGISGMNGKSDHGEITYKETWTMIRVWASNNHIARLSFWSLNRDRPCDSQHSSEMSDCSGIDQMEWEFATITAGFKG